MSACADDYVIREARPDERELLMTFLEQHFFPREYLLSTYLKNNEWRIDESEQRLIARDMRSRHVAMIQRLPCLVAVERRTDRVVALNLMSVDENPAFSEALPPCRQGEGEKNAGDTSSTAGQHSKLLDEWFRDVLEASDRSVDLFAQMPWLRRCLKLVIICVEPKHGGRGLATRLVREAVEYARSKDIGLVSALFTSALSQKAAEKNGFARLSELHIAQLLDAQGKPIYEASQDCLVSVMAKVLAKQN